MIREVIEADAETVVEAAIACGLFSPDEIPTLRSQLDKTLSGRSERGEFWIGEFDEGGVARAVAFCVEEVMTDRVWNLLFLGVREELHHTGIGGKVLEFVESRLMNDLQRMLVIETTNGPEFEAARTFYRKHGYGEEGTVRDFYAQGADKIAFRKLLSSS